MSDPELEARIAFEEAYEAEYRRPRPVDPELKARMERIAFEDAYWCQGYEAGYKAGLEAGQRNLDRATELEARVADALRRYREDYR